VYFVPLWFVALALATRVPEGNTKNIVSQDTFYLANPGEPNKIIIPQQIVLISLGYAKDYFWQSSLSWVFGDQLVIATVFANFTTNLQHL
jgi:hypothetical protein